MPVKIIKVDERDNVGVIVVEEGAKKGEVIESIELKANIPFGHKMALQDIAKDEPITRYGVAIGYAKDDLDQGSWVNETNIYIKSSDEMNRHIQSTYGTAYRFAGKKPEKELFFQGYRNSDGTAGTRNILSINTTVQCAQGVVDYAVKKIENELLAQYPNVDGVVAVNHLYGCGVAIDGKGCEIPQRTIRNIADNPNLVEGRLVVALGCEKFNIPRAFPDIPAEQTVTLQDCHGMQAMVDTIIEKAKGQLEILNRRKREPIPLRDLVVGFQCGGSDAFSGLTANPAMGYAADLFVLYGAKIIFSEVSEVRDAHHVLESRMADPVTKEKLATEFAWYDNYLAEGDVDRSANTSLGNKAGGLSTIIEKAMGSVAKSGTSPIVDVISAGEKIVKHGMTFAATPASDFVCGTEQLASGITIQVFSSGRGTTYNLPQIPVIKVSTNPVLSEKWADIIDINAGEILRGTKTLEEMGQYIFDDIIAVASGEKKTKSDEWGIYNALAVFNPAPIT